MKLLVCVGELQSGDFHLLRGFSFTVRLRDNWQLLPHLLSLNTLALVPEALLPYSAGVLPAAGEKTIVSVMSD